MITDFKIFENKMDYDFEDNSYWVIYGTEKIIINVLKQITKQIRFDNNDVINRFYMKCFLAVINDIKEDDYNHKYANCMGSFIFCEERILYSIFESESEKNELMEDYEDMNFKGEIKLENDKIVFDPLEVDMNKYNL